MPQRALGRWVYGFAPCDTVRPMSCTQHRVTVSMTDVMQRSQPNAVHTWQSFLQTNPGKLMAQSVQAVTGLDVSICACTYIAYYSVRHITSADAITKKLVAA